MSSTENVKKQRCEDTGLMQPDDGVRNCGFSQHARIYVLRAGLNAPTRRLSSSSWVASRLKPASPPAFP